MIDWDIDWDFETRLIDRIAVREAAAKALSSRERRVMSWHSRGDTSDEIAAREGCCRSNIYVVVNRSIHKLRGRFGDQPTAKPATPQQTTRSTPPVGFDRGDFLRHMQGLIARREVEARETFERERAALDDLIEGEQPPPPHPKPPPAPKVVWQPLPPPKPLLQLALWVHPPKLPQVQAVEPWFDPARMPSYNDMQQIAVYALDFLVLMRLTIAPTGPGLRRIGTLTKQILCRRDADAIATEVGGFARGLPYQARLSAVPVSVPEGGHGVSLATSIAAVRVVSVHNGQNVLIDITWDP